MAKHTITIINKGGGGKGSDDSTRRISYKKPKTSATTKSSNAGVSRRNKSNLVVNKTNLISNVKGMAAGIASAYGALKLAQTGINIYATINAAATGEEITNSNLKTFYASSINPLSFGKDFAIQSFLGNLRNQRVNRSLEYQRELTGNMVYSKNFNNGTF